jgi:prepilin-type N-terminal cleavage/methylation domain-containing protein
MQADDGFTILEMLVAVGLVTALLLAAAPSLGTALNAADLLSASRETAQYVRLARATAVGKNLPSRVVVSEDGSTLTIEVLRSGTWSSTGTPLVLGGGTTVASIAPSASALSFSTQGTTSGTVTITLHTVRGDSQSLEVSLLGMVESS